MTASSDAVPGAAPSADAQVRPARPGDAAALGRVHSRAWREAYAELLGPEVLEAVEADALAVSWRNAVVAPPDEQHRVLVATAGTEVVGLAATAPSQEPDAGPGDAELAALVVDPVHQRHGHGSRLLNAAVDLLREEGVSRLTTWTPAADEPRLVFLRGAGLAPDGARRELLTSADGRTVTEVRLSALLTDPPASP